MSTSDNLSPAGSSTYDSSSMYVGDGTWDSDRNTFLLPNLQGLNFATMQYNGMGNRFRDLPEYHSLVTGHGVIAAITFLGIVPGAIFIARFLHTEGRLAFKMHVYMQIITVFLATVVLILGWFAVGPERSLTNPHHGIGVAIYVCVLVQFIYGWWMTKRERKRTRPHPTIPVKVHLHRLFGRAVALLAFVQVALGLTLYGSPKVLFILYALWGALLLFAYLALEYRNKARLVGGGVSPPRPAQSDYYSDYTGSYITGDHTQLTGDGRRRDRSRDRTHWGRDILAGAGLIGAYEWVRRKRDNRRVEKENTYYEDSEMTGRPPHTPGRPGSSMGPPRPGPGPRIPDPYGPTPVAGYGPTPSAGYGPPPGSVPPPATYAGARPPSRGSHRARRADGTVMSPESWEDDEMHDEKYGRRPERRSNTWRDRILGAGAGIAAFEGVKSMFGGRKKRNDGYVDSQVSYRPGDHSMVSQTDVSRVEAGQAPFSPGDQRPGRRVRMEDTSTMTPTRPPMGRRPTGIPPRRSSMDSMSYDDEESYVDTPARRPGGSGGQTLRESMAAMGAFAGFREWNKSRRDRREQDRNDRIRQQELANEEQFNRRNSNRYPRPQDASGRRESLSGTIMTGPQDPGMGSHPELSRTNFRPDTLQPPLPAAAGTIPSASGAPPSTVGPSISQQHVPPPPPHGQHQQQTTNINFPIPPPPPGPPPNAGRPADYQAPVPGSLAMPQGAVNPDPSRLVSEQTQTQQQGTSGMYRDGTSVAAEQAAAAAAGLAADQRTQSQSPSRRRDSRTRQNRRGSSAGPSGPRNDNGGISSPPVSLKMNVHPDGGAVTLRRLNEEEAAAERAARRRERRSRRASSLSSGGEEPGSSRYRRNGAIRRSSDQPITNVPPPPAMSSSAGGSHRPPSELNLPPVPQPGRVPQASDSPVPAGLLPAASGPAGSGAVGSPPNVAGTGTDMGTGTDVSAFETNRRRRRAERMRRGQGGGGGAGRVEFE